MTRPIGLTEIQYPVFRLGEHPPTIKDGLTVYISHFVEEDDTERLIYRIVDDKNLPGDTMAKRRILLAKSGVPLKKISRAVFFLGDLIKIAKSSTWFIDANGNVFNYKKTHKAKLTYKKITKLIAIPTGGSIVEVEDSLVRYKCLYSPKDTERYAIILIDKTMTILYGFSEIKAKDSWRMV